MRIARNQHQDGFRVVALFRTRINWQIAMKPFFVIDMISAGREMQVQLPFSERV